MSKKRPFRHIFTIVLSLGTLSNTSPAVARSRYWPTGVQLSMEIANSLYYKCYQKQVDKQYEFNASIDVARLLLEGDYGWGSIQRGGPDAMTLPTGYSEKGQYFLGGLNYNLVPDTPSRNVAFLGMRYARSLLQDSSGEAGLASGPELEEITASWYEVVAGVKVKVWQIFYVGSTVRYKFGLSLDKALNPQHVFGWGFYQKGDEETLGFTCYLSLRIPFERYRAPQNNSPKK